MGAIDRCARAIGQAPAAGAARRARPCKVHLHRRSRDAGLGVRIRPYDPSLAGDWLRLVNLTRVVPIDTADFARRDAAWPASDLRLRFLGIGVGRTLAIGQISAAPYAPPDHLAVLVVSDPDHCRAGGGAAMLTRLEAQALTRGFAALTATVPEGSETVLCWAERRGYRRHGTRFDSLLDLNDDHAGLGEPAPIPGIACRDMTGATEGHWRLVLSLFRSLLSDAPDMQGLPSWSDERCRMVLRDSPLAQPHWIIVAWAGGCPIGVTVGQPMGEDIFPCSPVCAPGGAAWAWARHRSCA